MKTRIAAVAASLAALSFATLPLAQAATAHPVTRSGLELRSHDSPHQASADGSAGHGLGVDLSRDRQDR